MAFGFAEVLPDRVTILAQIAERADEVDVEQGRGGKATGRAAPDELCHGDMDLERARIALLKSLIRLQVAARARIRS